MKKKTPSSISNNLNLPIIVAPMFLISGVQLVVSCCQEGIIGSFPLANARTIEDLDAWMQDINDILRKERIDHPDKKVAPWAVNIITHRTYDRLSEELVLIKKHKPEIVITSLGSPLQVVDVVHSYGGIVLSDVNSVHFARKASATGIDGLVLVSSGAGGHTGMISPFAFMDEVLSFWDGMVVLAGSISSGRALRAAEILGADIAYMGTKFIATKESMADVGYKEMLVQSSQEDIVLTSSVTGIPAHFLRRTLYDAGFSENDLTMKGKVNLGSKNREKKAWKNIWSAGHGVGTVKSVQSVKELVKIIQQEYHDSL